MEVEVDHQELQVKALLEVLEVEQQRQTVFPIMIQKLHIEVGVEQQVVLVQKPVVTVQILVLLLVH